MWNGQQTSLDAGNTNEERLIILVLINLKAQK